MVLSDIDIRNAISNGQLNINPLDPTRLKPASYTFCLSPTLWIPKGNSPVDTKNIKMNYQTVSMDEAGFIIKPGMFLLGQTHETISLGQDLCCQLDARTSLARIGLVILQGSTFIEPGQNNSHETLEITNVSPNPIKIYPYLEVVKGIFLSLLTPASHPYSQTGKYAGQQSPEPK